jgi:hypothetical protein
MPNSFHVPSGANINDGFTTKATATPTRYRAPDIIKAHIF